MSVPTDDLSKIPSASEYHSLLESRNEHWQRKPGKEITFSKYRTPFRQNTDKPSGCFRSYPYVPLSGQWERALPDASAKGKMLSSVSAVRVFAGCPSASRPPLVADADAATVPGRQVPHLQQFAVLVMVPSRRI